MPLPPTGWDEMPPDLTREELSALLRLYCFTTDGQWSADEAQSKLPPEAALGYMVRTDDPMSMRPMVVRSSSDAHFVAATHNSFVSLVNMAIRAIE